MPNALPKPATFKKLREITEGGCLLLFLLIVLLTITGVVFQKCNSSGFYRGNYEGKVISKGIITHESQLGSSAERYLVIEEKSGIRFSVYVTMDLYKHAQIGMWIRKTETEQELSPTISSPP
jgi:hypothetical protein